MVAGGYRAIDSLRVEKGYRVWGADITPSDTPFEAGLGFAVKLGKGSFVGRDALRAANEGGPTRRLRTIVLDDAEAVCLGGEPVRFDGEIVGRVTSGGYGFRVGASIAFAFLPVTRIAGARVGVEVFGEWVGATVAADAVWDPSGARIRA
jgi:4-methylaminobutanoate oxidase (formaldehyde-forming)